MLLHFAVLFAILDDDRVGAVFADCGGMGRQNGVGITPRPHEPLGIAIRAADGAAVEDILVGCHMHDCNSFPVRPRSRR